MSLKALQWAFSQDGISPTQKLVLIAMSNFAGESGKTYPSLGTVRQICCLQKDETVSDAIGQLMILGMLEDTGAKTGKTGRTAVYQLPTDACQIPPQTGDSIPRQSPANPPFGGIAIKENRTRTRTATPLTEEELIKKLKDNAAYSGIDVARELGKSKVWCSANRRVFTERFFVNWLNRIEKPIATAAAKPVPDHIKYGYIPDAICK
jgi:hypothetical protein